MASLTRCCPEGWRALINGYAQRRCLYRWKKRGSKSKTPRQWRSESTSRWFHVHETSCHWLTIGGKALIYTSICLTSVDDNLQLLTQKHGWASSPVEAGDFDLHVCCFTQTDKSVRVYIIGEPSELSGEDLQFLFLLRRKHGDEGWSEAATDAARCSYRILNDISFTEVAASLFLKCSLGSPSLRGHPHMNCV